MPLANLGAPLNFSDNRPKRNKNEVLQKLGFLSSLCVKIVGEAEDHSLPSCSHCH